MQIGDNIRKIRELKGYSQENVAIFLEMSQRNYSRLEKNQIDIKLSHLVNISKYLEVDINNIIAFNENALFKNKLINISEIEALKRRIEKLEYINNF